MQIYIQVMKLNDKLFYLFSFPVYFLEAHVQILFWFSRDVDCRPCNEVFAKVKLLKTQNQNGIEWLWHSASCLVCFVIDR